MPLTYGSAGTSNSVDTLTAVEGFVSLVKVTSENTVDAWGTVKLPSGDFQSLRLKELSVEIAETSFNGVPVFSDTSHSISYTWIAKNVLTLVSIGAPENVTDPNFTEAATFIWSTDNNINTIEGLSDHSVPGDFILEQNYPNPFNMSTRIRFSLPLNTDVRLIVYNILGQRVATLADGNFARGRHVITWDGHNTRGNSLSSGIYIYRLTAGGFVSSRKMVLVK